MLKVIYSLQKDPGKTDENYISEKNKLFYFLIFFTKNFLFYPE